MPFSARLAKIILILCFLPAAAVTGAMAQSGPDEGLRRDVEFLSDSLCTGRKTGTAGSSAASFYIIHHLRSLGYEVRVEAFGTSSGAVGHNIIGFKPGFTGRALLLMASYDGLGKIGGRFYPGADSNASGTAALLSLAERFKDRSDLVLTFVDGHNANLSGAEALKLSLRNVRLRMVASLDILGSTLAPPDEFWKNYLIVLGGAPFRISLEKAGAGLHLYYDYYGSRPFTDLFYRKVSDHKVFLDRGIPVLMFTSGITLNTNREGDTWRTLDFPVFAKRVEAIGNWLENQ